jgi:hypothetical protein
VGDTNFSVRFHKEIQNSACPPAMIENPLSSLSRCGDSERTSIARTLSLVWMSALQAESLARMAMACMESACTDRPQFVQVGMTRSAVQCQRPNRRPHRAVADESDHSFAPEDSPIPPATQSPDDFLSFQPTLVGRTSLFAAGRSSSANSRWDPAAPSKRGKGAPGSVPSNPSPHTIFK